MEKILIERPEDYQAETGDIFEMHFKVLSLPVIEKFQKDLIVKKINASKNTKVIDTSVSNGTFIVTMKIVDNPFPLVLAIGGVITVLSGFFVWASLGRVYKLIDKPVGAFAVSGAAIAAVLGLFWLLALLRKGV